MSIINLPLKARIIEKYGTQLIFSRVIGKGELFVSQVITGRRKLKPEDKKHWARALKSNSKELFTK